METKKAAGIGLVTVAGGIAAYQLLKKKVEPEPECTTDADCPLGYTCEHGICVKEPVEGKAVLWGIARNAKSKLPIPGIVVAMDSETRTTGADGKYEFLDVEPGTYTLSVSDPSDRYETPAPITVTLEAGETMQRNIELLLPEEYDIGLSGLRISIPTVAGYPVTITCWAKLCTGPIGVPVTRVITLYVNGIAIDSITVTLTRTFLCASQKLEFEYTPPSAGLYNIELDGLGGVFEATEPVFTNTPLELVKNATEFADEMAEAYGTGTNRTIELAIPFLQGASDLRETHFTFDPTGVANLNCTIELDLGGYSGWTLGATLIAIRASEYESWLNNIRFIDWGHPGRLGAGVYGLGFPLEDSGPPPLDSQGYPSRASICGRDYDCKFIHREETYGGWQGCNLKSGDHEFNINGLLDLEPGSWVVLASFVMSICNAFESPGPRGTTKMTYLPLDCYNYKIYKIGTISF